MYRKYILAVLACMLASMPALKAQAPARKLDTTMKVGKSGYRVTCYNKSLEKNTVTIKPINFEKSVNEFSMDVRGRLSMVEVDDINRDGFPDLLLYVFAKDSLNKGSVIGVMSENNESLAPIVFPDIFDDPKLRVGYKGNDSFFLLEGNLIRRFPVYPVDGAPAAAATGNLIRQVQYQVIRDERGSYKFKPLRTYDFTKQ